MDTILFNVSLSTIHGLADCNRLAASCIDFGSQATLPVATREAFLRECGLPDNYISQLLGILNSLKPVEFYGNISPSD